MFKIYNEPETPYKGACLIDMMNRNRHTRCKIYDESESPDEKARLKYMINQNFNLVSMGLR